MALTTYESLAADAAAYLARSGDVVPRSRGDALELRRQSGQLYQWAQNIGCLINYTPPADALKTSGAEHEVFFHQKDSRVFKKTHAGTFGSILTELGLRRTATPYFYLLRLELTNQIFSSDLRLEGVMGGDKTSIVISQPWAYPSDPRNPLPSSAEVKDFMMRLGFEPVAESPFEWFRKTDGVRVSDAKLENFIKSKAGVVPIDLIVSKTDP